MTGNARIVTLIILVVACVVISWFILTAGMVLAHGVELEIYRSNAIEVVARFDTGEPMAEAQVAVFAPNNPAEPWLTGLSDQSGRFTFVPDSQLPGLWEVQVRQAGHGGLIRVEVGENDFDPPEAGGLTMAQKLLMAAAVTWGLIGTALFFSRRGG